MTQILLLIFSYLLGFLLGFWLGRHHENRSLINEVNKMAELEIDPDEYRPPGGIVHDRPNTPGSVGRF